MITLTKPLKSPKDDVNQGKILIDKRRVGGLTTELKKGCHIRSPQAGNLSCRRARNPIVAKIQVSGVSMRLSLPLNLKRCNRSLDRAVVN